VTEELKSKEVPPPRHAREWPPEEAAVEVVRGRLQALVPTTARELAAGAGVRPAAVEAALAALETEGFALRGHFTPGGAAPAQRETEWCERRLLARIHRYTLERLRREIEPVSQADFMRFLLSWQRVGSAPAAGGAPGPAPASDGAVPARGGDSPADLRIAGASGASAAPGEPGIGGAGAGRPASPAAAGSTATPAQGAESLPALLAQLEGFEAPAAAW